MSMKEIKDSVNQEAINLWDELPRLETALDYNARKIQSCLLKLKKNKTYKSNADSDDSAKVTRLDNKTKYVND